MIIDVECPHCAGTGEHLVTFDCGEDCKWCLGTGTVEKELEDECDD